MYRAKNIASSKSTLYPQRGPSNFSFLIYIIVIYIRITISSINNIKIILKLLRLISPIKYFLPFYFSIKQWFSNDISINVTLKPRIQSYWRSLKIFFKKTLKIIGLLLIIFLANLNIFFSINKNQYLNKRLSSSTCTQS